MAVPTEHELAQFVEHFDFVRPLGGFFHPLPADKAQELRAAQAALNKHAVSKWVMAQPAFNAAVQALEARPFYKRAGPANQILIRTRFLIDIGCALAGSRMGSAMVPSIPSLADRKTAITHARALSGLIDRGISLSAPASGVRSRAGVGA